MELMASAIDHLSERHSGCSTHAPRKTFGTCFSDGALPLEQGRYFLVGEPYGDRRAAVRLQMRWPAYLNEENGVSWARRTAFSVSEEARDGIVLVGPPQLLEAGGHTNCGRGSE